MYKISIKQPQDIQGFIYLFSKHHMTIQAVLELSVTQGIKV